MKRANTIGRSLHLLLLTLCGLSFYVLLLALLFLIVGLVIPTHEHASSSSGTTAATPL